MNRAAMKAALLCVAALLMQLLAPGHALCVSAQDLTTRIRIDFSPIRAELKAVGEGWVKLSMPKGAVVSPGDIFTVFSRKGLGSSLETMPAVPSGKIQVTSVSAGSATCSLLERRRELAPGDIAIRYEGLRAVVYRDDSPISPRFTTGRLRALLPYLDWLEPHEAIMPVMEPKSMKALGIDLLFRFKDGKLLVYGPDLQPFKVYEDAECLLPDEEAGPRGQQGLHGMEGQMPAGHGEAADLPAPFLSLAEAEEIGRLEARPIKVSIEDLDGDGSQEIIYLLDDGLYIAPFRAEGSLRKFKTSGFETPYSFSVLPGKGLVALNVLLDGAGLKSALLGYSRHGLRLIQGEMNLWLAFVDTDCDQAVDTLLGQSFDRERFRSDTVFRMRPSDDGVEYQGSMDYPPGFNVNGNVQAIFSAQGGCSMVVSTVQGFLKVYGPSNILEWSSLVPVVRQFEAFGTPDLFMTPVRLGERQLVLYRGHPAGKDAGECWLCALAPKGEEGFVTYYALSPEKGAKRARICGIQILNDRLVIAIVRNESEDEDEPRYVTRLYSFLLTR